MNRLIMVLIFEAFLFSACADLRTDTDITPTPTAINPADQVFGRSKFGNAPFPFWFELTSPEIDALNQKDKAAAGDPDALLALSIFASGNIRETSQYEKIFTRVQTFVNQIKPQLDSQSIFWKKGFLLNRAMHAEFFPQSKEANELTGYDENQSQLTKIFTESRYNCISSSLLYLVLARYCNLQVKGVVLPSHAFVQIESPEGKVIEVETTTPTGFDWKHDESFYKKQARKWFKVRGLPSSSFKDYQNRKIVSPLSLVAFNMHNQHTSSQRMAIVDRYRLLEAMSYLDVDNRGAQFNRVNLYSSEYDYLKSQNDFPTSEAMFQKITPILKELPQRWRSDGEMANWIGRLDFEYASTLKEVGKYPEAFDWIDSSLTILQKSVNDGTLLYDRVVGLILTINSDLGKANKYDSAEAYFYRHKFPKNDEQIRSGLTSFYEKWVRELWTKNVWEKVIEKLQRELEYVDMENRKNVMENIYTAYQNWAITMENQGNWLEARNALNNCLEKYPNTKKCSSHLEKLKTEHGFE